MFVKVLSSVPHNHHYMIKYITFITKSQLQPKGKVKHHICPRKIWPEYKNLNENAWNVAFLTPREHFIAHLLLWKALPQHSSMAYAALAMQHKNNEKINSRLYETLVIETSKETSKRNRNRTWVNKGEHCKNILSSDLQDYESDGWAKGRIFSSQHKNNIAKKAIERYANPQNNPNYGKKHTKETREKMKIARANQPPTNPTQVEYLGKIYSTLKEFSQDIGVSYYIANKMIKEGTITKMKPPS